MRYSGSRFDRGGFSVPGGRVTLSVFFLILLAILLLFVHRADPSLFERWRTRVVDVSAPVLQTLSWPVRATRDVLDDVGEFWDVYKDNERLRQEIEDLKVWQSAALHYERQLKHYEALMKVQPPPGIEYVTARLIADAGSPFKHTFILNAGARHGIANGQGVVDGLDLVGRVVNVGDRSSRVLRLTDINSRIPVMVEPSRQRAIMAGDNSSYPKLEFVESELDIRAGDRVVTSGDGGLLPPGLPIGELVQREAGKFHVKPRTNHNRFETVRVVRFEYPVDVNDQLTGDAESEAPAPAGTEPETDASGPDADRPVAGSGDPSAASGAEGEAPEQDGEEPPAEATPVQAAENLPVRPRPAPREEDEAADGAGQGGGPDDAGDDGAPAAGGE